MAPKAPVDTPPRFGVAAIILNAEGKVLAGQRFGSHGAGSWQLPGGHLEANEGLLSCAARETMEEAGLDVDARRVVATTYDVFETDVKHYITWFVLCELKDPQAVPKAMEPHKCPEWFWKTAEELRGLQCFSPIISLFKQKSSLNDVFQGSAPLLRLRRGQRHDPQQTDIVSVKWDAMPTHIADKENTEREMLGTAQDSSYYAWNHGALTLSRGADLVVETADDAQSKYPLEILVVDPDDKSKTVAWPLGGGTRVVPPPRSHGGDTGSIELIRIICRGPKDVTASPNAKVEESI